MKDFWHKLNKFYFFNFALVASLIFTIVLMFSVQFYVENLQDKIAKTEDEIATLEDEIQVLEVQWVYLTRPARLRELSALYLQDNGYALASQIKNEEQLQQYHQAVYEEKSRVTEVKGI